MLYTVPSLAMLALLIPVLGVGQLTASIALVAYAQMLLVRNIATGLQGVSPAMVDAARGPGMTAAQAIAADFSLHALEGRFARGQARAPAA